MEERYVVYDRSGNVGTITLNRPAKLNAITFEMLEQLWEILKSTVGDDETRVIVLKGEGRYFSAGADLELVSSLAPETFRWRQRKYWNRIFGEFEDIQKLTIAALNGPAIGGGLELALCCDLRYSVEDASFSMPQINYGILPDAGGTVRLPWLLGLARAKEFILSGESIDARRAEELGLVNRIFSRETFDDEVSTIARNMAQKAPLALGLGKQLINRSFQSGDIRAGLEAAMDIQSVLITTEDYREAVQAFQEKRPPLFRGR